MESELCFKVEDFEEVIGKEFIPNCGDVADPEALEGSATSLFGLVEK